MSVEFFTSVAFNDIVVIVSVVVDVRVSVPFVTSVAFNDGTWWLGNYRVIIVVFILIVFVIVFIDVVFVSIVISVVVAFVVRETVASAAMA